eukprot:CAMPEP_0204036884 /NCGR_PEP_ID=MMETSP0360-20130528/81565_1 /ASSEMBLY_ACC=CAM_ASM_000342 /TAXON_ID=268821 /ORGANISM="Scrippsiella Hangoei, Strain SHTV-5" /LENGTH=47 /DNA_ID= /DNA_START= /DNA_END= /DNA_ORIENTATION=
MAGDTPGLEAESQGLLGSLEQVREVVAADDAGRWGEGGHDSHLEAFW